MNSNNSYIYINLRMDNPNFKNSIWKHVVDETDDDWKLVFNYNETERVKSSKGINEHQVKLNDYNAKKNMVLGTLVMTPRGIGRLTKQDKNVSTVKIIKSNEEHNFEDHLILLQFPIYIRILDKEFSNWHKIFISATSSVEGLKKLLEDKKIVPKEKSFTIIFNGLELKDEVFFDQLELRPESKLLLFGLKNSVCKVERFTAVNSWWYTYATDGITFNVNKKIRFTGIGMYGSHENKVQSGILCISEGNQANSINYIYEDTVDIPASPTQNEAVHTVEFKKSVPLKANQDYTIQFKCNNYCYFYYGTQGTSTSNGDKNVVFNFKFTNGSSHGSNAESGNFPVFYYLA